MPIKRDPHPTTYPGEGLGYSSMETALQRKLDQETLRFRNVSPVLPRGGCHVYVTSYSHGVWFAVYYPARHD